MNLFRSVSPLTPAKKTTLSGLFGLVFLLLLSPILPGQKPAKAAIQSGPMVGYSDFFEVQLWVQTTSATRVKFAWKPIGTLKQGQIDHDSLPTKSELVFSEEVLTGEASGFVAKILACPLEPGKKYAYSVYLNGKPINLDRETTFQTQEIWKWRNDPPPVTFTVGSCNYVNEAATDRPGKPYGSDYRIFQSIYATHPDFMVWLGDNTYLREPDWNSRTGILRRYTHTRSLPEMQALLGSAHHYAVWDDHDYGPNDSDRGYYLKETSKEIFDLFWGNQTSGLPGQGGVTSKFSWADLDFFMIDNRWFRSPNERKTGKKTMIGKTQFEWLIDNLESSKASWKFICMGGQVLNDAALYENYIALYPEERKGLLEKLEKEGIKRIVFLTGDRHHTELSILPREKGGPVYEITSSPLTATAYDGSTEANTLRAEGSHVAQSNFVNIEVSGPEKNRTLKVVCYDANGKQLWERVLTK